MPSSRNLKNELKYFILVSPRITVYLGLDGKEVIREAPPLLDRFICKGVMELLDFLRPSGAARMYKLFPAPTVLVCGGRDYANKSHVHQVLDMIHRANPIELLIHGDADGADKMADEWAEFREIAVAAYPADWEKHGRAAGPIRNAEMLQENPDVILAFPGGSGTLNMVTQARKKGIPVHDIADAQIRSKRPQSGGLSESDRRVRRQRADSGKTRSGGKKQGGNRPQRKKS